ncbi:hypothetical protein H7169_01655 [Candidatus Gracilibacteria bacterium]|nr:hypothetical protein [Candidatus Gracilibacteria bacterium]
MPHKKNVDSNENVEILPQSFFHPGVSYSPGKNEIKFSEDSRIALQQLVHGIQSNFPVEPTSTTITHQHTEKVTLRVADNIVDAMIIDGKGKKAVKRFLDQVAIILGIRKEKGGKIEEKVQQKVHKYNDSIFSHVFIQYREGDEIQTLHDTPIIVRQGEDIDTMLKSIKIRLRFPRNTK